MAKDKALESQFTPEELTLIRKERAAYQREWRHRMTPEERSTRNAQYALARALKKAAEQNPGTDPSAEPEAPKRRRSRKDREDKTLESQFTPEELALIRQERAAAQRAWWAKMTPEERKARNAQYALARAKKKAAAAAAQNNGTEPDGQTQSAL